MIEEPKTPADRVVQHAQWIAADRILWDKEKPEVYIARPDLNGPELNPNKIVAGNNNSMELADPKKFKESTSTWVDIYIPTGRKMYGKWEYKYRETTTY